MITLTLTTDDVTNKISLGKQNSSFSLNSCLNGPLNGFVRLSSLDKASYYIWCKDV